MSIPETSFHAETRKRIPLGQVLPSFCDSSGVLTAYPSDASTEAPDLSSSEPRPCLPPDASARPGEAATRLARRGQGVSERELENSQAAQAAHP